MGKATDSAKHHEGFFEGLAEGFDFFDGIVGGEGGAQGAGHAEAGHEWLAAMMAGAEGEAHLIEEGAEVVVVNAFKVEGEGSGAVFGTVDGEAIELAEDLSGAFDEEGFVRGDVFDSQVIHKVESGSEGDASFDIGRSSFEFEGGIVVGRLFKGDFFDHFAAPSPRR